MVTYGSYVPKSENLAKSAGWICALDTLVAVMAALAIGLLSVGGGSFGAYAVGGGAVGTQIAIGGSASAPLAIGSQAASGALTFGPGADPAAVTAAIRQAAAAAPVWLQDLLISLALEV